MKVDYLTVQNGTPKAYPGTDMPEAQEVKLDALGPALRAVHLDKKILA